MTQEPASIEAGRTAVVIMDFQNAIVDGYASDPQGTVARAAEVLGAARAAGIPVFHIIHRGGRFEEESDDSAEHAGVAALEGERVLIKVRAGSCGVSTVTIRRSGSISHTSRTPCAR